MLFLRSFQHAITWSIKCVWRFLNLPWHYGTFVLKQLNMLIYNDSNEDTQFRYQYSADGHVAIMAYLQYCG